MLRHTLLLALLALSACPRPRGILLSPLEDAARRAPAGKAPREQALAGFGNYLVLSKPDQAAPLFDAAGKAGDIWGTYGQLELARRSLDVKARIQACLRLCEIDPRHALCAVGARAALQAVGESQGVDALIEAAAVRLLAAHPRGDAAYYLRLAAAAARRNAGNESGARALWADAGQIGAATLLGPYSRYHSLDWDVPFAPEQGRLGELGTGPYGPIVPREARTPDGRFSLLAEPATADISYWAADFEVSEEALFHVRALGRGTFRVLVDNALAFDQREFETWPPNERVAETRLAPGQHRVVVKVSRGPEHDDTVWLAIARADGEPARLSFRPAAGSFAGSPPSFGKPEDASPDAAALAAELENEVGSALAAFVAARTLADRDEEGALALAEALVQKQPSAPFLGLRAEILFASRALPARSAHGRAHRDLNDALKLDPAEASALQRLSMLARSDSRFDESQELLEKARAVAAPGAWRVLLSDMRLAQARGSDGLADMLAQKALAAEPGLCDALELRYELARRTEAAGVANVLIEQAGRCPRHDARLAEHLRLRGDLAGARARFEALAEAFPLDTSSLQSAAQVALAQDKPREAAAMLERLEKAWPRHASFHKLRAEALERSGDLKGARAEKEAALALDGSDLRLRRALAIEDGKEVLDDLKTDATKLRALYDEKHGSDAPTTSGVYILDASAVEAHPDGSFTERTHILAKVLDQAGVSTLAEVHVPAGAQVLILRTLKADGRILEPEAIGGKEGMSLPGVEVGDSVEYEYLHSTPARGAALPGFAAPKFYLRIADGQLFHSVYTVRAPAGTNLVADAHNLEIEPVRREGAWEVFSVARDEMPTFVREPNGPTLDEVLPFVQIGTGAGLEETMASIGDFLVDRAKPNADVVRFAQDAAAGRTGLEAVQAVYGKVMKEIKGPEAALTTRATATLAQGRGSRLMLLKGALAALGIPSRVVLVRPFHGDPVPYRFPGADLYGYAALQVKAPESEVLLMPAIRSAPFGRIVAQAEGREAVVLPEVGEKPRTITTPGSGAAEGKRVTLQLAIGADGTLAGKGEERYLGMDAALLKDNLERMTQEQRRQAIEAAIARTFENGALRDLTIDEQDEPGGPVSIRFTFVAPGFARAEEGRLVVPRGIYPSNLSRRFLQQFERATPLIVGSPEKWELEAKIELPEGFALAGRPRSEKRETPFGRFERVEEMAPRAYIVRENASLALARVAPAQYRAFGDFLTSVDEAEQREVVFEKAPGGR